MAKTLTVALTIALISNGMRTLDVELSMETSLDAAKP
jgi:hypothetical protein